MAPEVFDGNYSKAADIWSCGVILFCMVFGFSPFSNSTEVILELKEAELKQKEKERSNSLDISPQPNTSPNNNADSPTITIDLDPSDSSGPVRIGGNARTRRKSIEIDMGSRNTNSNSNKSKTSQELKVTANLNQVSSFGRKLTIDNDYDVEHCVTKIGFIGEVKEGFGPWFPVSMPISVDLRELISKMLLRDVRKRWTVKECLDSPWLRAQLSNESMPELVKHGLMNFKKHSKFKAAISALFWDVIDPSVCFVFSICCQMP